MASHPKYELKQAKNGDYYFNLTAKNGQVIATSEMYKSKAAAENGIASVRENAPNAQIEDQSVMAA
ncbi:MAG TPA: YegP family protein [Alphaproteobacteria bacterium]|nr:YegP family protein [Alphaproteobacteria bacterium]HOO51612.1 YegP family protein [Alphaproteobacteria bacterium]